ncbi:hypothetical protein KM043_006867 [Ampulex compressa]|nr:hypothetical protein KM043_006867 [Ampulex compressa]
MLDTMIAALCGRQREGSACGGREMGLWCASREDSKLACLRLDGVPSLAASLLLLMGLEERRIRPLCMERGKKFSASGNSASAVGENKSVDWIRVISKIRLQAFKVSRPFNPASPPKLAFRTMLEGFRKFPATGVFRAAIASMAEEGEELTGRSRDVNLDVSAFGKLKHPTPDLCLDDEGLLTKAASIVLLSARRQQINQDTGRKRRRKEETETERQRES